MEIFIENKQVKFTQGVQTFSLSYEGNKKELKWMAEQLDTCFKNFMHEVKIETINEYTEKTIQNLISNKGEERLTDIEFVKWYSGIEEAKILSAYNRYLVERKQPEIVCPDCGSDMITQFTTLENSCQSCGYLWSTGRDGLFTIAPNKKIQ
jgi:predicted RNA-binding Zn-ribbon protein involved in translation (DUF1610 family)